MLIVAIDPGLRHSGMAVLEGDHLVWAGLVRSPGVIRGQIAWRAMAKAIGEVFPLSMDTLVVEQPQYDARTRTAAPDVLELTGVVTRIVVGLGPLAGRVLTPTPGEWKGQVSKEVMQNRLLSSSDESFLINLESYDHNVLDSVMLGRWAAKEWGARYGF